MNQMHENVCSIGLGMVADTQERKKVGRPGEQKTKNKEVTYGEHRLWFLHCVTLAAERLFRANAAGTLVFSRKAGADW